MFDILRLPSQDSHLEDFRARAEQAVQEGNERDAEHWESMANAERLIAGTASAEQETNKRGK